MTAFILIFVKNQAWSRTNDLHPILGVITTILCFIQPFGAYFRPPPYAPKRIIFNWGHFLIGNSAHLFGGEFEIFVRKQILIQINFFFLQ